MTESYLDYSSASASGVELSQLQLLAEKQAAVEAEIAELVKLREQQHDLSERQLPELMDQIGMAEFKTTSGLTITVKEKIRASITKTRAPLAFHWLRENGHAAMIKRVVSLSFGKGEEEKADEFCSVLLDEGLEYDDKMSVHPSTLTAFVKEQLENGEEIPLDLFGVHRSRAAEIIATK